METQPRAPACSVPCLPWARPAIQRITQGEQTTPYHSGPACAIPGAALWVAGARPPLPRESGCPLFRVRAGSAPPMAIKDYHGANPAFLKKRARRVSYPLLTSFCSQPAGDALRPSAAGGCGSAIAMEPRLLAYRPILLRDLRSQQNRTRPAAASPLARARHSAGMHPHD